MDVVGGTASVCQLVVYLASSAASLERLYTELIDGDSIYRDEATNIKLLLHTLQRLSRHHVDDHNPVIPVLISIAGIACQVLHLLQPQRTFGINWAFFTSRNKISSAFETLNHKRNLLHLQVSQSHQEALVDLKQTIESSWIVPPTTVSTQRENEKEASENSQDDPTVPMTRPQDEKTQDPTAPDKFVLTNTTIEGLNFVGVHRYSSATINNLTVSGRAANFMGFHQDVSDENLRDLISLQRDVLPNPVPANTTLEARTQPQSLNTNARYPPIITSSTRSTASGQRSSSRLRRMFSRSSGQSSSDDGSLYGAEGAQSGVSLVPQSAHMRNMNRLDSGIDMGSNVESEDELEGVPLPNVPQNAPEAQPQAAEEVA